MRRIFLPIYVKSSLDLLSTDAKIPTIQGDSKSTTQKLSDTARSGGQSTEESGKGIVESMEDAATNAKDTVSRALGGSGGSGGACNNPFIFYTSSELFLCIR